MKARWGFAGLAGALVALAVAGCMNGGAASAPEEDVVATGDAVSEETPSFVVIRRDFRKCMAPTCGGYFVRDVNRTEPEVYVSGLDFDPAADERMRNDVTQSPPQDLVLYGHLGPADPNYNTRELVVEDAYRGMPGIEPGDGAYFQITTAAGRGRCRGMRPCAAFTRRARQLNTTIATSFGIIDVQGAAATAVDVAWLRSRVENHAAIVLGTLETDAAGTRVVRARQVYVHLPEEPGPCLDLRLSACPTGQFHTYRRDENRCLVPTGCAKTATCPLSVPVCDDGYKLVTWPAQPNVCGAFACDPAFTMKDEAPADDAP